MKTNTGEGENLPLKEPAEIRCGRELSNFQEISWNLNGFNNNNNNNNNK
jgi:hypothetical protein